MDIPLKTEDFLIKNSSPKIFAKSGLIIIQYLLQKKVDENDEEFGDEVGKQNIEKEKEINELKKK